MGFRRAGAVCTGGIMPPAEKISCRKPGGNYQAVMTEPWYFSSMKVLISGE